MVNTAEVRQAVSQVFDEAGRTGVIRARLHVDSTGAVGGAVMVRGSGDARIDAGLLAAGRLGRFHPGLIDRRPVPVWVELDLSLEFECARGDHTHACRSPGRL